MDNNEFSSRISGFHNLSREGRFEKVARLVDLEAELANRFLNSSAPLGDLADHLSENVIGTMDIPLGIATNMTVDGEDVLVPMATEESSVIAAVCNGARQCRETGGIATSFDAPRMIAQIQVVGLSDPAAARANLFAKRQEIKELCDLCDQKLVSLGGGFDDIEIRVIGKLLVLHLIVDVRDAMGANIVNTMAERLAPHVEHWTGGTVGLKILSNLADKRLVRATAMFDRDALGGPEVVGAMLSAYQFAVLDPYRAATHNKGIMNGVSAVALATGNDTRAIEAGAHAYASVGGYGPLTCWEQSKEGNLVGTIELPMPVGIVGGATKIHPTAQMCLKIMNIRTANRLGRIMASVGLIQNFSAMKALATEGIQRGHMGLHARNVAIAAGATGKQVEEVALKLIEEENINEEFAERLLEIMNSGT